MARRARITLPGVPLHLIQRGHNRQDCFFSVADRTRYLGWLGELAPEAGCSIHAYVLMTNHVHLLLTPQAEDGPARLMKRLGQRYVQYVNRTRERSGTLWEGRFRSCLVQDDAYLLACQRYIELNPVRAGMVTLPGQHPWSSYRANAEGEPDPLVKPHELYLALGRDPGQRHAAYRALFVQVLGDATLTAIRRATNGNFALGDDSFQADVEARLGRRAAPGRDGRPRRPPKPEIPDLFGRE